MEPGLRPGRCRWRRPGVGPDAGHRESTATSRSSHARCRSSGHRPSTDPEPLRPAPGVYQYRGEGTEHLDKPPLTQSQGPDIPGTVTHLEGGCWRLRVDYSTNHWQSWDYCPAGTGLTERAGAFFQRLDLVVAQVETTST